MNKSSKTSGPCPTELTVVKRQLRQETIRRKTAEDKLKDSRLHYNQLLAQSLLMQEQLRHLSHQILLTQENERKHISRELHDEISQILTGINVRLAALKVEAAANTGTLKRNIISTQRLVEKSVATVHRFACELRPAMLDDLGLIPALNTFIKEFVQRTGLRVDFFPMPKDKIEKLDSLKRTVLYRVAQEALNNVDKHAHASLINISIQVMENSLRMEISDNGISFNVNRTLSSKRHKRLGIIGMRERVEMTGGTFAIESEPEKGTTVSVQILFDESQPGV
ncbi:MAG: sensor histidine kinase [Victivallaceae bacterium]|nr:sensor histidine kinase [Victivallaceae bacterium]